LNKLNDGWKILQTQLTEPILDIGIYQVDSTGFYLFGGWKNSVTKDIFKFDIAWNTIQKQDFELEEPDQFFSNGVFAYKNDKLIIPGHYSLHEFDTVELKVNVVRNDIQT